LAAGTVALKFLREERPQEEVPLAEIETRLVDLL
jgi:hypothetical protein